MKKALLVLSTVLAGSMALTTGVGAMTTGDSPAMSSVSSITLKGDGPMVSWTLEGTDTMGFKVVYSKNSGPTYPSREGDTYDYLSDPAVRSDKLRPFAGSGTYYVRVCEYLGGACGTYSNEITVMFSGDVKTDKDQAVKAKLEKMASNKEKILRIEDVKYFSKIEKIGDSLYGVRIDNSTKKKDVQNKINMINDQIKKLQSQLDALNKQLLTL